jgi:2-polyprenyl-6-hydroxyphenyl methylase/3-demethylubiquinone-9 3-methyltransferase
VTDGISYHDDRAEAWSTGYTAGAFKRRLSFLDFHLSNLVKSGSRWLDAGCGSGVLSRELDRLGAKVLGVDASSRMVDAAKRESKIASVDIDYRVVESIEHLDLPNASFDGVLCSSVVEYLPNPEIAFSHLSRVLVPGGYLVVTVPNRHSLVRNVQKIVRACFAMLGKSYCEYLDISVNEYTRSELRQLLKDVGLQMENVDVFDPILSRPLGRKTLGSLILVTARRLSIPDNSVETVDRT